MKAGGNRIGVGRSAVNLNTNRVSQGDNTFEYENFMRDLNVTTTGDNKGKYSIMNSSYM